MNRLKKVVPEDYHGAVDLAAMAWRSLGRRRQIGAALFAVSYLSFTVVALSGNSFAALMTAVPMMVGVVIAS